MTPESRRPCDETLHVDRETLAPLWNGPPPGLPSGGAPEGAALDWRVGHYVVERELGRGGMGIVHLAFDTELLRHVALKLLPRGLAARAASRQRFLFEARAMARVRDARVVGILQVLESEDGFALALDYIDGCTLADVVEGVAGAPDSGDGEPALAVVAALIGCDVVDLLVGDRYVQWVAHVGEEIGGALRSVHDAGVLHRDVKPSNVLLDRHANPHLSDFGVALDPEDAATGEGDDSICGTAQYASPEQLRGSTDLDARTDVYGLGALLYELLALRPPTSGSPKESLECIESRKVPRLGQQIATWVPRDLAEVVHKAMDPDRERRYATPAQFAADLRAFRLGGLVEAVPRGPAARVWNWLRQEPARLMAVALLLGLLSIGSWLAFELPRAQAAHEAEIQSAVSRSIAAGFLFVREDALRNRALEPFQAALARDPDSALALAGLALVRATLGDPEGARRELSSRPELLRRHPILQSLEAIGAEVYRRSPAEDLQVSETSQDPLDLFIAAISILRRTTVKDSHDEYRLATSTLRSALELSAGRASEHLHGELVSALAAQGEEEELRRAVATFRSRYGSSWVTHLRIAMALDSFDQDLALEAVERARELGADPIAVELETARIHRARGGDDGPAAAVESLSEAMERHPDAPELALALVRMLALLGKDVHDDRVDALLRSGCEGLAARLENRVDPALAVQTSLELAEIQGLRGDHDAARATLEAARARGTGSWMVEDRLAMLDAPRLRAEHTDLRVAVFKEHSKLGAAAREAHAEAIESFRRTVADVREHFRAAFDAAPYHKVTARNLGMMMVLQTGELEAAIPVIRRVHELEPGEPDHLLMLGMVLNQLGRPVEALEALERAGELVDAAEPSYSMGRRLLETARALLQLGRFGEAREPLMLCESKHLLQSRRESSTALALLGLVHVVDPEQRDRRASEKLLRIAQRINARSFPLVARVAAECAIALGDLEVAGRHLEDAEAIARRFIDCEPIESQRELVRRDLELVRARRVEVEAAMEDGSTTLVARVPR